MSVVLVTGANSGIGRATALAFARAGCRVVAGSRSVDRASDLRDQARDEGLPVQVVPLDVRDDASVDEAVRWTAGTHGAVDVLVNNAGVMAAGPVELQSDQVVRDVFETNFFGPLRLVRAVLPAMRRRRQGAIVLVSSLHGRVPAPNAGVYAASKQAAATLNDALSLEVDGFGIRVTCVEIGPYRTRMTSTPPLGDPATDDYAVLAHRLQERTARRLADAGDPTEVAATIVGLAEDPAPPLRVPVGRHALEYLDGGGPAERFRRDLREELGSP